MRALWIEDGVLRLRHNLPEPSVGGGEVRVQVELAGICRTDVELLSGYKGFEGIPGHELVGIVLDGPRQGQRVVAEINVACGTCSWCRGGGDDRHCPNRSAIGIKGRPGAFADRLAVPERNLREVPAGLDSLDAVFCEPLAAALTVREQLELQPDTRVLLCGDGNLGALLAQALHPLCQLTWVGRHRSKLEPWAARGYNTLLQHKMPFGRRYQVVLEATGRPEALRWAQSLLEPRGTLVLKTTTAEDRVLDLNELVVSEQRLLGSRCGRFEPALEALDTGSVQVRDLVEECFSLDDGAEAFRRARQPGARKILLRP